MAYVYQQIQVGDNGQDSGGYGQDAAEIDEQMKESAEETFKFYNGSSVLIWEWTTLGVQAHSLGALEPNLSRRQQEIHNI